MALKIIQWNINGLESHLVFLQKLINDEKPCIICIQETNFKNSLSRPIGGYEVIYKNRLNCGSASGGVACYIKDNIYFSEIKLNTNLEAVAISVLIKAQKICICNIYIYIYSK